MGTSTIAPFSLNFSYGKVRLQELLSLYTYLTANYVFKRSFLSTLLLRQTTSRAPFSLHLSYGKLRLQELLCLCSRSFDTILSPRLSLISSKKNFLVGGGLACKGNFLT